MSIFILIILWSVSGGPRYETMGEFASQQSCNEAGIALEQFSNKIVSGFGTAHFICVAKS